VRSVGKEAGARSLPPSVADGVELAAADHEDIARGDQVVARPPRASPQTSASAAKPVVRGKFLFAGEEKFYVRGVTYGTFRPDAQGHEFPPREVVSLDFEMMAANNVNALRTYTPPPEWLLDEAQSRGLRVMVGLAAERCVGYLNDGWRDTEVAKVICHAASACWGHPAVLCYAVANEIPAPTVRWFGRTRIERFIDRLCTGVREADPQALVTYVGYPSTEYLQLPFIDLMAFNVYLECPEKLALYLARLQTRAGELPLVMAELGLDSIRNGEELQADSLASQIETAFAAGCAGAFAYAWTDAWHRGGEDVEDWAFGLTRRDRRPKPALSAVRRAFAQAPWKPDFDLPKVSVVVCTFNGSATLAECLEGVVQLDYPDFEVIVVDDGSTDASPSIASEYPVQLISTENRGLSSARNTGYLAATGELVAYIDDDARPDRDWLQYLARTCIEGDWSAVGGPNISPAGDGVVADCVANAPGAPAHVLLSDREAEHVPGCNMAIRRSALARLGGFDPQFRVAGDDVDLCWRLAENDLKIGFSPSAVVWHHRRRSVRAYLRQQIAYGEAEALLERKWPQKYNRARHIIWGGRLYGRGLTQELRGARRWRVYYGSQGSAAFQSLYQPPPDGLRVLPLLPEWYLLILALSLVCLLGAAWHSLLFAGVPLLVASLAAVAGQALRSGLAAQFAPHQLPRQRVVAMRALTALLHLLQPLARLQGRLSRGLKPWRPRARGSRRLHARQTWTFWSDRWINPHERLHLLEQRVAAAGARIRRGGDFDRWDAEVEVGILVRERLLMSVEEHAGGAQLIRVRALLSYRFPLAVCALIAAVTALAALDGAYLAAALLGGAGVAFGLWFLSEASLTSGLVAQAIESAADAATPVVRQRRGLRIAGTASESNDAPRPAHASGQGAERCPP
jgi:glycosyltransferase involved in cell wall biosynthesis